MGELTYYLPEIVFGVFALVAIIWGILFVRDMVRRSGGKATCTHCKGNASKLTSPPYLFLLPISFGTKYDNPESYLRSHMVPILRKDRIPTGRRACHVDVRQKAGDHHRLPPGPGGTSLWRAPMFTPMRILSLC